MVDVAHEKEGPERSLEVNRYIGDFVLFAGGFFPSLVHRGAWFTPSPMVSRVGGVFVKFNKPMDYYVAEGRNAYQRAARTAEYFDPPAHGTYERLGARIEDYLHLLGCAKAHIEREPEFPEIDGFIA